MRASTNVSLPPSLREWVDSQVETGGYGTASEFIRDILRQARARQAQTRIDSMLMEAVESKEEVEMDAADWAEIKATARKEARQAARSKRK